MVRHTPIRTHPTPAAALLLCAGLAACEPVPPLLAVDAPLPERLSELPFEEDPATMAYTPVWPLWSNGLDKRRWFHVPDGRVNTEQQVWDWPLGSLLFKEFAWDGEPVETRVMRRVDTEYGWEYATYLWEGDDAVRLAPDERVELADPAHDVPSRYECRLCHEPAGGPIGLRPSQLAPDALDVVGDVFDPPVEHAPIEGHDAKTTAALGYFVGNCVHCHDGRKSKQTAFDLRPDVALDNLIGVPTEGMLLPGGRRIEPGSAEDSQLFLALQQADTLDISAMPPAGVQRVDSEAVALFREWIDAMPPLPPEDSP